MRRDDALVRCEVADRIAVFTINRPAQRNAIDAATTAAGICRTVWRTGESKSY